MRHAPAKLRARAVIAGALALAVTAGTMAGAARAADDLCGRPREAPDALYQRLTRGEKLAEAFRDKAYATINDAAKATIWTFTVAGHPAHPSVVCRHPVEDGDKVRIDMGVQCEAGAAECEELVRGFEALNQKMLKEAEKQRK
jgi:hypothetical protein